MGHRALVAYRRADGLHDVRYSHWGGADLALADRLTADSPLAEGAVAPQLLADALALERVLAEHLDPCVHETLYVVTPDFAVTGYVVFWLGWADGRNSGRGGLVPVDSVERDREVRTWFRATKTTLADVVEMGVLSLRAAQSYLEARVSEDEEGRLYTYEAEDGANPSGASGETRERGENGE